MAAWPTAAACAGWAVLLAALCLVPGWPRWPRVLHTAHQALTHPRLTTGRPPLSQAVAAPSAGFPARPPAAGPGPVRRGAASPLWATGPAWRQPMAAAPAAAAAAAAAVALPLIAWLARWAGTPRRAAETPAGAMAVLTAVKRRRKRRRRDRAARIKRNREEEFRMIRLYGVEALKGPEPQRLPWFDCDCGRCFATEEALGRHYREARHPLDPDYDYLARRPPRPYLCGCGHSYPSWGGMESHRLLKSHSRGRLAPFYCERLPCSCGELFLSHAMLLEHQQQTGHPMPEMPDVEDPWPDACGCGQKFGVPSKLLEHWITTGHLHSSAVTPATKAVRDLIVTILYHSRRPIMCSCAQEFPTQVAFERHQMKYGHAPWMALPSLLWLWNATVGAIAPNRAIDFRCACGAVFPSPEALQQHQTDTGHPPDRLLAACRSEVAAAQDALASLCETRLVCSCLRPFRSAVALDHHQEFFLGHTTVQLNCATEGVLGVLAALMYTQRKLEWTCTCGQRFPSGSEFRCHMRDTRHPTAEQLDTEPSREGDRRTRAVAWRPPILALWGEDYNKVPPKLQCDCGFPHSPRFMPNGRHWCRYWGRFQCRRCDNAWTSSWVFYGATQRCKTCNHLNAPVEIRRLTEDLAEYPEGPHPTDTMCSLCRRLRRNCSRPEERLQRPPPKRKETQLRELLEDPRVEWSRRDRERLRRLLFRNTERFGPSVLFEGLPPPPPPWAGLVPTADGHPKALPEAESWTAVADGEEAEADDGRGELRLP